MVNSWALIWPLLIVQWANTPKTLIDFVKSLSRLFLKKSSFFVTKRANEKKLKLMSQIPIIFLYQLDSRIIKLSTIPITEEAFIS